MKIKFYVKKVEGYNFFCNFAPCSGDDVAIRRDVDVVAVAINQSIENLYSVPWPI